MQDDDLFGAFESKGKRFKKSKLLGHRTQPDSQKDTQASYTVPKKKKLEEEKQESITLTQPEELKEPQKITIQKVEVTPETTQELQSVKYEHANGCRQEWIAPPGVIRQKKPQGPPAKEYPFELDTFQKVAVDCIERGESVMVAAHTSAGKTAVAQYAIAHALRRGERVVYTSPIKALSNQKYRELDEQFPGEVGLVTGDVSLKEDAAVLIMTTQILRAMLYKGSEVTREMRWVIFDEVHYLRDKERGVVWEETIALLPSASVRLVFLSATVPNAPEFASWVATIKQHPCSVVATDARPVPLAHYVEVPGGEGLYLVVDANGKFKQNNFIAALTALDDSRGPRGGGVTLKEARNAQLNKKQRGAFGRDDSQGSQVKKVVKLLVQKNLDPAIIFAFSKRECEAHAISLSKQDLTTDAEKDIVQKIYENALQTLADQEQNLPHVVQALDMLKRGIGVHHGGLLPIVKEVTEILFQQGLLKVLFTTETFAMGLNMPAKTVVFTSLTKFDGESSRPLTGSEYIQMSGRAGRRGKDKLGLSVVMLDQRLEPTQARSVFQGQPERLYSAFTLRFNMLLNLLRLEGVDPLHLLKLSFYHFQATRQLPRLRDKYADLKRGLEKIQVPESIEEIFKTKEQTEAVLNRVQSEIREIKMKPENSIPFCSPGRFLRIKSAQLDFGWGIALKFYKKRLEPKLGFIARQLRQGKLEREAGESGQIKDIEIQNAVDSRSQVCFIIDCLVFVSEHLTADKQIQPGNLKERKGELVVMPVTLDCVQDISMVKMFLPQNLKKPEEVKQVSDAYFDILRRFGGEGQTVPLLDPVKHMNIGVDSKDTELARKLLDLNEKQNALIEKAREMTSKLTKQDEELLKRKSEAAEELEKVGKEVKETEQVGQQEQLKAMMRVLRRLQFITQEGVVQLKGRVACEISSADEVLVTQLIFSNSFKQLDPYTVAALLSCFVAKQIRESGTSSGDDELKRAYYMLYNEAERVSKAMLDAHMLPDEQAAEEYVKQFKPDLMGITYAWCAKTPFSQILKTTELYEGTIIRCLRRLAELLKQLASAAKSIGTTELYTKFEEARQALSHGIVFVASLYIS